MNRACSRRSLLAASSLVVASAPIRSQTQTTRCSLEQAEDFAENMASRDDIPGLTGGRDVDMIQEESRPISTNMIDETLRDFTVTVTFVNPLSLTNKPWDFAIGFHSNHGPDGQISQMEVVTVDSTGWLYYAPLPGGLALGDLQIETFDGTPGATTTIDLWVVDRTAYVGVNGKCRVPVDLLHPARASGVSVGTGFDPLTREPGRVIGVRNFEVWPLVGSVGASVSESTPEMSVVSTEPLTAATPVVAPASQ